MKAEKRTKTAPFRATVVNILGNLFLFTIKIWAALVSGSIALLSEAFNSLTDIVSSIAVFICVRISDKEADEGHPFGHSRAEPVAGIVVAVFAGILGFEVIRTSFNRLVTGKEVFVGTLTLFVPVITAVLKGAMFWYFRRVGRAAISPAIIASSVDSLSDVFVAIAALVGIAGVRMGYWYLDPMAGLVISLWIIYTGYRIGMENIDYLMGKAPDAALMDDIKRAALMVKGVKAINTARAHYVGPFIQVEMHVEVPMDLSTSDSHAIGKEVERNIERIGAIQKAFIHIDPV
ncbi:MAG TPA: cation diffusion facilitator family transporter [Thermodesulfobacteriota bacterium]|nr:cation diffusion facilitator family transporter [Thermodesulfobacteriota bacterium]